MTIQAASRPTSAWRNVLSRRRSLVIGLVELVAALVVWHLVVDTFELVNRVFYPAPGDVWRSFIDGIENGTLTDALSSSALNWVVGYGFGVALGVIGGVMAGTSRLVSRFTMPLLWTLWATPMIALMPVLTVWFGYGRTSVIVLVFLSTVIPVMLNSAAGCKGVSRSLLSAARVYGGTPLQVFRYVRIPWVVPSAISGARIAINTSLIGLLVGEMVGSPSGVGEMITVASSRFQTATAFVGVFVYVIAGAVLIYLLGLLERRFARWKGADRG